MNDNCPALLFYPPEPLNHIQAQKWFALTGHLQTAEWWRHILQESCIIAGGAALFIADDLANINDVGDVDVWVPQTHQSRISQYVAELTVWCTANGIKYTITIQTTIVTVRTPYLDVQFIIAIREYTVADVLSRFDFDCVQCALVYSDATRYEVSLVCSHAAVAAHSSRIIKWRNPTQWIYRTKNQTEAYTIGLEKEKYIRRIRKLNGKNFYLFHVPYFATVRSPRLECIRQPRPHWNAIIPTYNSIYACWNLILAVCQNKELPLEDQLKRMNVDSDAEYKRFSFPVPQPTWILTEPEM